MPRSRKHSAQCDIVVESFRGAAELADEKAFVLRAFGLPSLHGWQYGEVRRVNGTPFIAASFAAQGGALVVFAANKPYTSPPVKAREVLRQCYARAVGHLGHLRLVVGYRVDEPGTLAAAVAASDVLAPGYIFVGWHTVAPGTDAWARLDVDTNRLMVEVRKALRASSRTRHKDISSVELNWASKDIDTRTETYKGYWLHIKIHIA